MVEVMFAVRKDGFKVRFFISMYFVMQRMRPPTCNIGYFKRLARLMAF